MVAVEMSQMQATANKAAKGLAAEQNLSHGDRLLDITNRIHSAKDIDEILIDLTDDIIKLFEAKQLTVYSVDGIKKELVSRIKSEGGLKEIRVPIATDSLAGYAAFMGKLINIKNVYDDKELAAIDPNLRFDSTWDEDSGFRTRQALVAPVNFQKYLMGVIQVINCKDGVFTEQDESAVQELATTLGIAIYNQKRMAKARPGKFDYLVENGLLTQKELDQAILDSRSTRQDIESFLMQTYKLSKKEIGSALSQYYQTPFVEYNERIMIPGELLTGLKVSFLKNNVWVPIERTKDDKIAIAIDNPFDLQKIDLIKPLFLGADFEFRVAMKEDILKYIHLFFEEIEKKQSSIDEIIGQLEVEEEEIQEAEKGVGDDDSAVVQLANKIILDAYERNASDIHIEPYPGKKSTEVRFRVDGACYLYQTVPYNYRAALVSRLKIMSDLDIAERRKPQDGKIKFKKYGGKDIELRVATVPTAGGMEDVVMRILAAGEPLPLDKMGFSKNNLENFLSIITQPYGIIFVCGPTGSGKTTTLHSALGYINKPDIKIWTAEDPVEITQVGLRQVQVHHKIGFDFATAMRSFLRADPDVVMVGEMRDRETTHIGIEASLTGHLVFSTLHTNSAPESITRLLDMGMDPFNFADAILGILAQRLVRTLCKSCKKRYKPSQEEYDELVREYGPEDFEKLNIPFSKDLRLYKTTGCNKCNNTGYRGRMGIHELLMGTDEMKKLVQLKAKMEDIRGQAIKDGMTTLKQDGIDKVFGGYTDLLQVRKVCIK